MLAACAAMLLAAAIFFSGNPQKPVSADTASSAACISDYFTANAASSQESGSAPAPSAPPESSVCYIVREYNGRIGVFLDGTDVPVRVADTDVKLLPAADRESLKLGKKVRTLEEAERLLEDYDG